MTARIEAISTTGVPAGWVKMPRKGATSGSVIPYIAETSACSALAPRSFMVKRTSSRTSRTVNTRAMTRLAVQIERSFDGSVETLTFVSLARGVGTAGSVGVVVVVVIR